MGVRRAVDFLGKLYRYARGVAGHGDEKIDSLDACSVRAIFDRGLCCNSAVWALHCNVLHPKLTLVVARLCYN